MTKTWLPLFLLTHLICAPVSAESANRIATLVPHSNVEMARVLLDQYLRTGDNDVAKQKLIEMQLHGQTALIRTLDTILLVYQDPAPATQARVDWALNFLMRIALRTASDGIQIDPRGKRELSIRLGSLLREYQHTHRRLERLTNTYDYLSLWSPDELWFLAPRAATMEGLIKHYAPLMAMAPYLNDEQAAFLEQNIRKNPRGQLVRYMALYGMNRAKPEDYERLFLLYSDKFAEAFQAIAMGPRERANEYYDAPNTYRDFEDVRRMAYYNEALRHLRLSLLQKDETITDAFHRAKTLLNRSNAQDGRRPFRELFFSFLEAGSPDLMLLQTIQDMAEGSLRKGEYVLPEPPARPEVRTSQINLIAPKGLENNIISLAEIRARRSCSLLHRKNK